MTHRTAGYMANTLQVGIPHALGLIVGVTDIVAYHRRFAAKVTLLAHDLLSFPFKMLIGPSPWTLTTLGQGAGRTLIIAVTSLPRIKISNPETEIL